MQFKILEFANKFGTYYMLKIDGKKLEQISNVDLRRIENNSDTSGMQRQLDNNRCNLIAEYIDTDYATFPNSVILKLNENISYEINNDYFYLNTDSKDVFTIIDGQHRIAAFKKSIRSFDIPASVYIDLSPDKMIEIFRTVNSTQKPVNASLRLELESESFVYNPEKFAVNLAKRFVYELDSPLKNRIQMYGDEKSGTMKIKQTLSFYAFTTEIIGLTYNEAHYHTIKSYLYNNEFSNAILSYEKTKKINDDKYIFWTYYSKKLEDRAYKLLLVYFSVLSDVLSIDWDDTNSILLKSVGIRAIMKLFLDVYKKAQEGGSFKYDDIKEILLPLKKLNGKINNTEYSGSSFGLALKLYTDMKSLTKL
ncbi:DGQHR domain-containing protein [Fusibacter tunisiensis]|uniref:DGQHR domain-containing protein n=1 Tax=Fusibacter tunisiensis TaxID=1008308 RepID=A0ABS2MTJ8_9FIRM|nr:DGQHR domain-containing protein [Fusibacter tunisiensis]MBM7562766.1 DGQHR domain-containing protein [Fusibacter tunisiensis]